MNTLLQTGGDGRVPAPMETRCLDRRGRSVRVWAGCSRSAPARLGVGMARGAMIPLLAAALAFAPGRLNAQTARQPDQRTIDAPYLDPERDTWPQIVPAGRPPPSPTEIAAIVERLGAPRFADREQAARDALEAGAPMFAALREASVSDDPELRLRSKELLLQLSPSRHGSRTYPELLRRALTGSTAEAAAVVETFMNMEDAGVLMDLEVIWSRLIDAANADRWAFGRTSGDTPRQQLLLQVLEAMLRHGDFRAYYRARALHPYLQFQAYIFNMLTRAIDTRSLQVGRYTNASAWTAGAWNDMGRAGPGRVPLGHVWDRWHARAADRLRWDPEQRCFVLTGELPLPPIPVERQRALRVRLLDQILDGDQDRLSMRSWPDFNHWRADGSIVYQLNYRNEHERHDSRQELVFYDYVRRQRLHGITLPDGHFYAQPHPTDDQVALITNFGSVVRFHPESLSIPDLAFREERHAAIHARFLPDGRRWVAANHHRFYLLSYPDHRVVQEHTYDARLRSRWKLSPSGRYAVIHDRKSLIVVDILQSKLSVASVGDLGECLNRVVFTPDDLELWVPAPARAPHVIRYSLPDLDILPGAPFDFGRITALAIRSDGRRIALAPQVPEHGEFGEIVLYDPQTKKIVTRWVAMDVPVKRLQFHPDPKRNHLLIMSDYAPLQIWEYEID